MAVCVRSHPTAGLTVRAAPVHPSAALKVHLIGVGGTGMGAFAGLLQAAGHEVRGSDTKLYPPMSTQLEAAGIPVFEGFRAENLDWGPDCVVVGNVCGRDHVEVVAAQARGLPLESFPSLLETAMLPDRRPLVIAGTHGKTTTTSLVAWILTVAGQQPSALVGGVPINFERGHVFGRGPAIVLEGDEYDTAFFDKGSKFFHYRPYRAIVTSVEFDHADIFADLEAVKAAFVRFVALIPAEGDLVVSAEDAGAMEVAKAARCPVTTYRVLGEADDVRSADYTCRVEAKRGGGRTVFEVFERGASLGEFSTTLVGTYNLGNILAAAALARKEGVSVEALRDAIRRFRGVRRRQELVGIASGIRVVMDFAHHPTAVRVTTTAIRKNFRNGALHVCFEPRSASSRRAVFEAGYAESFAAASRVYVGPLFRPEKIPPDQRLDPVQLARGIAQNGIEAAAYASVDELAQAVLAAAAPGDTVLLLTSGAFGGLADKILTGLGDAVMFGTADDMPEVQALCRSYELVPTVMDDRTETLVLRDAEGKVVGCVSLRISGAQALLFNLAVARERRGEGLGWILADGILRRARILGVNQVYLVTTGAADFFAGKLGATPATTAEIDPALREAPQFAAAAERGVCMKIDPTYRRQARA
jgi:UDP-N-acetylmuramate: L-alanyl-gamma-D-glutamyl-meso-diaminopimelate ligase